MLFGIVLLLFVLYIGPFVIVVSGTRWRSLLIRATLMLVPIAYLWYGTLGPGYDPSGNGFGDAIAISMFFVVVAGTIAGAVARIASLALDFPLYGKSGFLVVLLSLFALPMLYQGSVMYGDWKRRPPDAECSARTAFPILIGETRISVPYWPTVTIHSEAGIFSLDTPFRVRELCFEATEGGRLNSDLAAFSFRRVSYRPSTAFTDWYGADCTRGSEESSSAACVEMPIDDLGFKLKTTSPSEVPDCYDSSNGYPLCRMEIPVSEDVVADIRFSAWDGDVDAAASNALAMVSRLASHVVEADSEGMD